MQTLSGPERTRQLYLLVFSILAMLVLLGYGTYNLIVSVIPYDPEDLLSLGAGVLGALSMLACAGLVLPILIHSVQRLKGKEIHPRTIPPIKVWQAILVFVVWVASVLITGGLTALTDFGWLIAIPFFLTGALLPVILLAWVAVGGLIGNSPRRLWAVFGTSLGGSTFLAMLLEYLVIGAIALIVGAVAYANPEVKALIEQVRSQLKSGQDIESMLMNLAPYLTNPLLYVMLLALGAGIGPMIEEAVKPIALWFLGKNLHSPAEGFALGAVCGAGFALVEGMLAASGAVETLGFGLAARFTSTLLHISASGLVGWGIASARLEKRYWRLLGAYLLACTLHGLWNGSIITTVYGSLRLALIGTAAVTIDAPGIIALLIGIGMLGLTFLTMLVLLPIINWRLRLGLPAASSSPAGDDIIAPLATQPERTTNGVDSQSS